MFFFYDACVFSSLALRKNNLLYGVGLNKHQGVDVIA